MLTAPDPSPKSSSSSIGVKLIGSINIPVVFARIKYASDSIAPVASDQVNGTSIGVGLPVAKSATWLVGAGLGLVVSIPDSSIKL